MLRTLSTSFLAATSVLAVATPASAFDFDAQGHGVLDAAAFCTDDFEGGTAQPDALEGTHVGVVTPSTPYSVRLPIESSVKRVSARYWARGVGTGYLASSPKSAGAPLYASSFFPTGRVTSDGWVEFATEPVVFDGSTIDALYVSLQTTTNESVEIDALEVVAEDAPAPTTCNATTACGTGFHCLAEVCLEDGAGVPGLPPAAERTAVADLFESQLRYHFGGLASRRDHLQPALAELEAMKTQTTAGAYWHRLHTAMHSLHDAHTFAYVGPYEQTSLGTCFVEGHADVSGTGGTADRPDILVSHALGEADFHSGDQLVAVDGQHPIDFMIGLEGRYPGGLYATDPASHSAMVGYLRDAIALFGHEVSVATCASNGTCAAPTTRAVSSLAKPKGAINCDYRFEFPTDGDGPDPVTHELAKYVYLAHLAGTPADSGFYGIVFDSFMPEDTSTDPFAPLLTTVRTGHGMLIDHRIGFGGDGLLAAEFSQPVRPKARMTVTLSTQGFLWRDPIDQAVGQAIFANADSQSDAIEAGSDDYDPTLRAAVMTMNGESSGDFFPFYMKGPKNVRIFGGRTQGAFSTAKYFSYWGMGWGFGSGETWGPDGLPMLGKSLVPDEVILPKQSDALQGVDTVLTRARTWLTDCTDCTGEPNP